MTKLIQNVQLVDAKGLLTLGEIFIEDGKIAAIGENLGSTSRRSNRW